MAKGSTSSGDAVGRDCGQTLDLICIHLKVRAKKGFGLTWEQIRGALREGSRRREHRLPGAYGDGPDGISATLRMAGKLPRSNSERPWGLSFPRDSTTSYVRPSQGHRFRVLRGSAVPPRPGPLERLTSTLQYETDPEHRIAPSLVPPDPNRSWSGAFHRGWRCRTSRVFPQLMEHGRKRWAPDYRVGINR